MWDGICEIKPRFHTQFCSITAVLEVHLSELGFDLDYTVSASDILFAVSLHSQQEISLGSRGGWGLNPCIAG